MCTNRTKNNIMYISLEVPFAIWLNYYCITIIYRNGNREIALDCELPKFILYFVLCVVLNAYWTHHLNI